MKLRTALAAITALVSVALAAARPAEALQTAAPGGAVFVILPGATATSATVAMAMPSGVPIAIGVLNPTTGLFSPSGLGSETARATAAEGQNASGIVANGTAISTEATLARKNEAANAAAAAAALQPGNALSELAAVSAAARANLGLGTAAVAGLGQPNGAASLGSSGTVPLGQIPVTKDNTGVASGAVDPIARSAVQPGSAAITGGTINGTSLGATTPAPATITQLGFGGSAVNMGGSLARMSGLNNTGQTACAWNYTGGGGETDCFSNRGGGGTGGIRFFDYSNAGAAVFLFGANGAGQARVGNYPLSGKDWLETLIGGTTSISQLVSLSNNGTIGALGGCRTSDNALAGSQGCQGLSSFASNDNTTQIQTAYAHYAEARRYAGAGITQADEHDIVNLGSVVVATPTSMGPAGATIGDWASCGRTDVASTNCTVGLGIINNGAAFEKAIIVSSNSLDTSLGGVTTGGIAMEMANAEHVKWLNANGGHASITFTGTLAADATELQFTDTGAQIVNSAAMPLFSVAQVGSAVNGLTLTADPTGAPPILAATGSDASIAFALRTKGPSAPFYFQNGLGNTSFQIAPVANGANYIDVVGAAAGLAPQVRAVGTDTNIDLNLISQGTGRVLSTGNAATTGHNIVAGATPALSSCGTSPTISGSDNAGLITTGTGATACTFTFATAYANPPYCTVTDQSGTGDAYSITATAITLTVGAAHKVNYQCTGQAGG